MPRTELSWRLELSPHVLWPVMADTDRFNEALTLPPYTLVETPRPDGTVQRLGQARVAGFELAWEEKPYEWIFERLFRQTRIFTRGPFRRFGPVLTLVPDGEATRLSYALEWEPLTLAGRLFGRRLARQSIEAIEKRVMQAAAFLQGTRDTVLDVAMPELPPGARERLAAMVRELAPSRYAHGLGQRLADHLLGGAMVDLARMRPKVLARQLGVGQREATELCLAAARAGMLTMRWDLLCPMCRGPKQTVATLDELPRGAHCPSCNVDYGRDFSRNVELTFAPAPTIRPLAVGGYCLSGPSTTPHVLVQQLLAPREVRTIEAVLPAGPYRLRTLHPGTASEIEFDGERFPGVRAHAGGVDAMAAGSPGTILLQNDTDLELALLIEQRGWVRDALTAHEVTTMQAFRDLFAQATLRPGDEVEIGRVALLFTDLRGSTELYERVGDARAYNMVREHFAFLAATVRDHGGAVVKTIGDAVMAAFGDPADAVKAALEIQRRIGALNRALAERDLAGAGDALVMKLGVHEGACIGVTLNDRLDYFGSTVNMAARLQGQSRGGDIVLSVGIAADPAVRPLLEGLASQVESVSLKGFAEPVPFVRLSGFEAERPSDGTAGRHQGPRA